MKSEKTSLVEELVTSLSSATWSRKTYPSDHPTPRRFMDQTMKLLNRLFDLDPDITIGLVEEEVVFDGRPILGPVTYLKNLVRELKKRDIEKIVFRRGVSEQELGELISLINTNVWDVLAWGSPRVYLQKKDVRHILLGRLKTTKEGGVGDESGELIKIYRDALEVARRISGGVSAGEPVPISEAKELSAIIVQQITKNKDAFLCLTNLRSHDEYTYTHAINVALLTAAQGGFLGFDEETLNDFAMAGLLHDIGKQIVPVNVINKKGSLDNQEWELMRRHPVEGAMILRQNPQIPPLAVIAAFEHHCRYDLTGYPRLTRLSRPNLIGMIVAVSDCYDAMRSLRSYQKDLSAEEAHSRMQTLKGKVLNPALVELFLKNMGPYPPGTFVRLSDGRIAMISEANSENPLRPKIKIIKNVDGEEISFPLFVDLLKEPHGAQGLKITNSVDPLLEGITPSRHYS